MEQVKSCSSLMKKDEFEFHCKDIHTNDLDKGSS